MSHIQRRRFLVVAGVMLAAAHGLAQAPGKYRIGVLLIGWEAGYKTLVQALLEGLRERGYALGSNLTVEFRYASSMQQSAAFADELVALKPDILVGQELTAVVLK